MNDISSFSLDGSMNYLLSTSNSEHRSTPFLAMANVVA